MGFEYLSLLNDKRNDCMSSMWLTVHQGYVDHFLQMVLLNMARKKVDAENMMIKLNPKNGVPEIEKNILFNRYEFESLGDAYIYQDNIH